MSRYLALLTALLMGGLALVLAGCGGGSGSTSLLTTTAVRGTVVDTAGANVAGATVTANGKSVTTDANGAFTLTGVNPGNGIVVGVSKTGYVATHDVVSLLTGQTAVLNFALQDVGIAQTFNNVNTTAVNLTDDRADGNNATVDIPVGSILNADDTPATTAVLAVTTALPSDASYVNTFPGLFMGTAAGDAAPKPIESFGFVDVNLTDANGNKLKLDPTKPATITFPVDPANDPGDATIPLWTLNEATGIWEQHVDAAGNPVVATRGNVGGKTVYTAQVIHFSPHNLDRQFTGKSLIITVTDLATGGTVSGATVTLWSSTNATTANGRWEGRAVTGADGKCTFAEVPDGWLAAQAVYGDRTGTASGFDDDAGTMEIALPAPAGPVTVTVLDHQGNAVSGASVALQSHGQGGMLSLTATTTANGVASFANVPSVDFLMVMAMKGFLTSSAEGPRKTAYTVTLPAPAATSSDVKIIVKDTDGTTLVDGATVELGVWLSDFVPLLNGTTNAQGEADFSNVPDSDFAIKVTKGNLTASAWWSVGQSRTITVQLAAPPGKPRR
jgi:hypothetical protein